jgi:hypothetical protein
LFEENIVSAIKHALARLDGAIANLEGSVRGMETSLAGKQRDMFSVPVKESRQNGHAPDNAAMARKLDLAIEKVEEILREG